jgi:hypothetical protein
VSRVDLDELTSQELAELASAKRLRELTEPPPPRPEPDEATVEAWVAQERRRAGSPIPLTPGPAEWATADPRRLTAITMQMCRFTRDDRRVAVGALELAEGIGIDEEVAIRAIATGIREARALPQSRSEDGHRGA